MVLQELLLLVGGHVERRVAAVPTEQQAGGPVRGGEGALGRAATASTTTGRSCGCRLLQSLVVGGGASQGLSGWVGEGGREGGRDGGREGETPRHAQR
jgi:hypothetical protein